MDPSIGVQELACCTAGAFSFHGLVMDIGLTTDKNLRNVCALRNLLEREEMEFPEEMPLDLAAAFKYGPVVSVVVRVLLDAQTHPDRRTRQNCFGKCQGISMYVA
jgi:hypothetical protein